MVNKWICDDLYLKVVKEEPCIGLTQENSMEFLLQASLPYIYISSSFHIYFLIW